MNVQATSVQNNRWERIWLMAKIEFKLRYLENKLGLLWALIKPISQIFMYYVVFEIIMSQGVENYVVYLYAGLLLWMFFTESTSGTVRILRTKKYLYEYTNMSKIEIYLATMISNSIGLVINLIIFFIGAAFHQIWPSVYNIYFVLIYLNLLLLSFGTSLILSNLYLLFKDVSQIWTIIVGFGFFLSPILYRGDLFSTKLPFLDYANPIAGIINNTREILLYARHPDWTMMAYDFLYAGFIFLLGYLMLKKYSVRASELI